MKFKIIIIAIIFCLLNPTLIKAAEPTFISKEYTKIPEVVGNKTIYMVGRIYKPKSEGPFPLIIITHGRDRFHLNAVSENKYAQAASALACRGYSVLVLVRRGYGKSEGGDNENSPEIYQAAKEGAKDIEAAISFMKTKPFVDGTKIVLIGKTIGGTIVMAASTLGIPGVIGVINFGGGGVVDEDYNLIKAYGKYGKDNKLTVPTLWIYTTNDHSSNYSIKLPNKMYEEYTKNGGKANYIVYGKWGALDGHDFFDEGIYSWMPYIDEYFHRIGLENM